MNAPMSDADKPAFAEQWGAMLEMQAGDARLDDEARARVIALAFGLLCSQGYTLAEVLRAMNAHCLASPFVAKPADIARIIDGEMPGDDALKALAIDAPKNPTALGIMTRWCVSERAMTHADERALLSAVRGVRAKLVDFRERSLVGKFTDEEIRRMVAAKVRPSAPIAPGAGGCRTAYREALVARCRELAAQKKIAPPREAVESESDVRTPESEAAARKAMDMLREAGITVGDASGPAEERVRSESLARGAS